MPETDQSRDEAFENALELHRSGQFEAAVEAYRAILEQSLKNGAVTLNLGHALRNLQREDEAETMFRQATELPDSAAGAWYNLGNLQASRRDFEAAEGAYRRAIELQPTMAPAHFQLAAVLRDTGRIDEAIPQFRHAIENDPDLTSAHMNLGNCLRATGRLAEAAAAHRTALTLAPESWEVHYNLARVLEELGDPAAEDHVERALDLSPQPAAVHHGYAEAAATRGAFARAVEHFQSAVALEPAQFYAQVGLGRAYMRTGRREEALRTFTSTARAFDGNPALLSQLATAQWRLKLREEPIALLRRVVQLLPDNPDALVNLARALSGVWAAEESLDLCEKALALSPGRSDARLLKGYGLVEMGRVDDGIEAFRRAAADDRSWPNASLLFSSLYSDKWTAADVADLHRTEGARWSSEPRPAADYSNVPDVERRLRIGYLSPDFKGNHPVAIFHKPLLRNHDRKDFEIFAYSSPDYVDETTAEIQQSVDYWRDVTDWPDARLARTIEEDRIDILIDLAGHTAKTRVGALRGRPAPIQACYIGYPHSTSLPFIDYLIADDIVAPPLAENLFTETLLRVEGCVFCFAPDDPAWPPIEPEIARNRQQVVFGSFNHVPKLTDSTVMLWSQILRRVPDSRLRLKAAPFADPGIQERYRRLFVEQGIATDRLAFEGPSEFPELMAAYRHIDIGHDPAPYNGGTTTYQALWMGVPVVTLAGDNFCSRMGASILQNLGHEAMVTETPEAYIDAAVALANDAPRRAALRTELRETILSAQSCNAERFTRNLEDKLRAVWRDWCRQRTTG
ncbi:MAG: hypothetical protein CMM59_15350 [Rhodospirillaceae bacterium]|nr:hypothetical protein [Rhodospirillaceae bacterium]